ncbi:MAG: hypothetical protein AAFQ07_09635, partial [Chloroflexota bacterium]
IDLTPEQSRHKPYFIQDSITLSLRIKDNDGNERPITIDEASNLERASVWYTFNVEQRIRDHFADKTNVGRQFKSPKPLHSPHVSARTPYDPKPGNIKRIPLGNDVFVYARELQNTFFAIHDSRTSNLEPPADVIESPVLFVVSVSLSARVGWQNVGFVPLKDNEYSLPKRYIRNGSKPDDIMIVDDPYDPEFKMRQGSLEEARGLEPAFMWDNYQVENRIRAFYAGKPWSFQPL